MSQGQAVEPAWFALPVEQYLLQKWDLSSTLPPEKQRQELVRAFIAEDETTTAASGPGSASASASEEVREAVRSAVLEPWRAQRLRRIAGRHVAADKANTLAGGELVILRTWYGGGAADDARFRGWLEQVDPFEEAFGHPADRWWRVLDDNALFDLGDDDNWRSIYDVLPELAAPGTRRAFDDGFVEAVRELVFAPEDGKEPEVDDYEDAVMVTASNGAFLLVADQQAFEEERLGLVFRDSKGNVIREGTIKPEEVQYLREYNTRGAVAESEYWLDAAVGKKYRTLGKIMCALLPIVMKSPAEAA